ncbi:SDR family oxidoreductase [Quadrisphaera sp. DSM 44207]|uniref:SDR family oxidoreductase n=1 Tax=Quadrisphaera sp. DSM 44207 TaxID=1881057 RepID=UPI0008885B1A|nr:SDR family oxidoreductase [Quadrisphaera sp. DSM 44207]SDQ63167.1 NAD(P)H dehydrogenase (quinone) [Quadrisphaera sp. DSM 44207]
MPVLAVTAATGRLGRLVVRSLLERGVPAGDVVALARTPSRAGDLAELGVQVREGDYSRPQILRPALEGVASVLLVSGDEVGRRVAQHTAVVEAARDAGVGRVAYTSILRAGTTQNPLAPEHRATEEVLRGSGLAWTLLRNGWYAENYTDRLAQHLATGEVVGASGQGRVAAATRADYAAAAAAALAGEGHEGAVYELAGSPFTMADLAATITQVTGTRVRYRDVSPHDLVAELVGAGLDEGSARFVAALEEATARGDLDAPDTDLVSLLGRPSTPLADAVRAAAR